MELDELPDLLDWLIVDIWTIEEAAMLWAAIDPYDHENTRLQDLKGKVSILQYKRARTTQRAISEAVCGGTLPFIEALIERNNDYNAWMEKIEFPNLPEHDTITPHMTRISRASFMKWANSREMPSYRIFLQSAKQAELKIRLQLRINSDDLELIEPQDKPIRLLAAPLPFYIDPENEMSIPEVCAVNDACAAVYGSSSRPLGASSKDLLMKFLNEHDKHRTMSNAAKERIVTVCNDSRKGGAPKTPN